MGSSSYSAGRAEPVSRNLTAPLGLGHAMSPPAHPASPLLPSTSGPDAARDALEAMVRLLKRLDIEDSLRRMVRRCAARLTLEGFEPSDALEAGRETLSTDACVLTVSQSHATGAHCGLLLRARLLLMARPGSWGRGFLHLELSREGLPVLPLPGPESLLVQLELGKRGACEVPLGPEAFEEQAQALLAWLGEIRDAFDAPLFAERTVDALAP